MGSGKVRGTRTEGHALACRRCTPCQERIPRVKRGEHKREGPLDSCQGPPLGTTLAGGCNPVGQAGTGRTEATQASGWRKRGEPERGSSRVTTVPAVRTLLAFAILPARSSGLLGSLA